MINQSGGIAHLKNTNHNYQVTNKSCTLNVLSKQIQFSSGTVIILFPFHDAEGSKYMKQLQDNFN